jgi:hypothetical protein
VRSLRRDARAGGAAPRRIARPLVAQPELGVRVVAQNLLSH